MMNSPDSPAPFTNSLRSDILLLSTFLSGRQSSSCDYHVVDENLKLFVDISTLLSIANNFETKASNVNAVMGKTTAEAIDFLICVENAKSINGNCIHGATDHGPVDERSNGPWSDSVGGVDRETQRDESPKPADEVGDLYRITPIKENGRRLLLQWDLQTLTEKNFTFESHLQDLFDVIVALNCDEVPDLFRFQSFIHHRVYHKLGNWILHLSTHWGNLPFHILSNQPRIQVQPKTFQFKYQDPEFHALIQSYVPALPSSLKPGTRPVYCVNSDNASQWFGALKGLWVHLQNYFLITDSKEGKNIMYVKQELPNAHAVDCIVAMMFVFDALMPLVKHLLSGKGVSQVLNAAVIKDSVEPEGNLEVPDLGLGLTNNNIVQKPEESVKHLLRSMEHVLSWHTSCRHIFTKARRFQHKTFQWRLSQFRYHDEALTPCSFDVETVLPLIQAWQGPSDCLFGSEEAKRIIRQTLNATVHAEAALMHWIATVNDVHSSEDWPIGVSEKSCQLCWLLHHAYNRQRTRKFVLPGTHGTFIPWLPPPGLDDNILIELRDALLTACKTFHTTPKQNSTNSTVYELDVPYFHQLAHAFVSLRNPGTG